MGSPQSVYLASPDGLMRKTRGCHALAMSQITRRVENEDWMIEEILSFGAEIREYTSQTCQCAWTI